MQNTKKDSIIERLEMFKKADSGENPICPRCKKGHIISMCNRKIYQCDNKLCNVTFSVYR